MDKDFEFEVGKEKVERVLCGECGKSSFVFTTRDWLYFHKHGVCEKCFFLKVQ